MLLCGFVLHDGTRVPDCSHDLCTSTTSRHAGNHQSYAVQSDYLHWTLVIIQILLLRRQSLVLKVQDL